jgi:hypothetical protein
VCYLGKLAERRLFEIVLIEIASESQDHAVYCSRGVTCLGYFDFDRLMTANNIPAAALIRETATRGLDKRSERLRIVSIRFRLDLLNKHPPGPAKAISDSPYNPDKHCVEVSVGTSIHFCVCQARIILVPMSSSICVVIANLGRSCIL